LWRSELAGQPRDAEAWAGRCHEYANGRACRRPGSGLADLHVILAQGGDGVMGAALRCPGAANWRIWRAEGGVYPFWRLTFRRCPRGFTAFERRRFFRRAGSRRSPPLVAESGNALAAAAPRSTTLIEFTLLRGLFSNAGGRQEEARESA